jgi:hypothetical protein
MHLEDIDPTADCVAVAYEACTGFELDDGDADTEAFCGRCGWAEDDHAEALAVVPAAPALRRAS